MSKEMEKAKQMARQADADVKAGVTSLTGKKLEGEAAAKFKKAYDGSAMLQAMYNPDGTMKSDMKKIVE